MRVGPFVMNPMISNISIPYTVGEHHLADYMTTNEQWTAARKQAWSTDASTMHLVQSIQMLFQLCLCPDVIFWTLEKAVAIRNSLLETFSGKFQHAGKLFSDFPAAPNAIPAKFGAFSGKENGCWKIGPAFGNAPGLSRLTPPQPSWVVLRYSVVSHVLWGPKRLHT